MLLRFLALMRAILAISRLVRDPKWNRQPQDRSSQTEPGVLYASVYLRRVLVNWAHSNRKAKPGWKIIVRGAGSPGRRAGHD
jgi:hypothetical protein